MQLKTIIIIGLMLSTILLTGCQNSYNSCMSDCKLLISKNISYCVTPQNNWNDAWDYAEKCSKEKTNICFEKCK